MKAFNPKGVSDIQAAVRWCKLGALEMKGGGVLCVAALLMSKCGEGILKRSVHVYKKSWENTSWEMIQKAFPLKVLPSQNPDTATDRTPQCRQAWHSTFCNIVLPTAAFQTASLKKTLHRPDRVERGSQRRGGVGAGHAGWVGRELGGLASNESIIDQLVEEKHAHWGHRWIRWQ